MKSALQANNSQVRRILAYVDHVSRQEIKMTVHEGFFMARQPIYDQTLTIAGYELLYRSGSSASACVSGDDIDIAAIANILVEVGLDRLAGDQIAFINVPVRLLGDQSLRLLPCHRVVLEILEDIPWSANVEAEILNLKSLGYTVALDDYVFSPEHDPFLEVVDIVKVDVMGVSHEDLAAKFPKIKRPGQKYLAEKVETYEDVERCMKLGFDYMQGYFFSKPSTIRGSGIPANYASSMSLLAKLQDPSVTLGELETLLVSNIIICHKILRLVNSAAFGLARPVESIKQALLYVGTGGIRTLASLSVLNSMQGKPPELYSMAMIRARYCQSLAKTIQFESPEKHFTVGLLSVLDALTDLSMDEVVSELPLSKEISDALCGTDQESPCSKTLNHVMSVERGDWVAAKAHIDVETAETYMEAVDWARKQTTSLAA